jgi:hypothetical protein
MKLKAQNTKFKGSSKPEAPFAPGHRGKVVEFAALNSEFLLSFELWILSF